MAADSVNCTRSMTRVDSGRTFAISDMGTSRSHVGHQRFCWMRVWHSAWSWLKLIVAAESVAGNTRMGMLTRLTFRNPFHVGRMGMRLFSRTAYGRADRHGAGRRTSG